MANDSQTSGDLFEVGIIYPLVNLLVTCIKWLNISEWFKLLAAFAGKAFCNDRRPEAIKKYKNFGFCAK